MQPPIIRDYQHHDCDSVVTLWQQCFPEVPSEQRFRELLARTVHEMPRVFKVALHEDLLIGTAIGGIDGISSWIYLVAVHEEFRRRGVGAVLVGAVEDALRDCGVERINLQVFEGRDHVVDFYRTLGYKVEPRISMGKRFVPKG